MHEYPITQNILQIAETQAKKRDALVCEIILVVGEYSGYMAECIRLYFDILSEGTLCEHAKLTIKNVKPKLRCPACGQLFTRKPFTFACPNCGTDGEPTDIGREFYVESVVLDSNSEDAAGDGQCEADVQTENDSM